MLGASGSESRESAIGADSPVLVVYVSVCTNESTRTSYHSGQQGGSTGMQATRYAEDDRKEVSERCCKERPRAWGPLKLCQRALMRGWAEELRMSK